MPELGRILQLPRRTEPPIGTKSLSELVGGSLRPIQAWALAEAWAVGGLVGPIGVGQGKTLITLLLPNLLGASSPLLVIPAKLREKTLRDIAIYRSEGWWVADVRIISYELLGHPQHADDLLEIKPDLIMADEAHRIKNKKAAVTKRIIRFCKQNQHVPFIALSGTLLSRSIRDCAHIFFLALKTGSPLPITWVDIGKWADVLDDNTSNSFFWGPGDLSVFGRNQEEIREATHARIVQTAGVVASGAADECQASLRIQTWDCGLPPILKTEIKKIQNTWERPDGEILTSPVDVWRHIRTLTQGFYYRWEAPPPKEWLERRREWARFVRETLRCSKTLDSAAQVARKYRDYSLYLRWKEIEGIYVPKIKTVWLSSEIIEAAAVWAQATQGIIWVDARAAGEALGAAGVPYYGAQGLLAAGPRGSAHYIEDAVGPISASIRANAEGRNLQHKWSSCLVLSPPGRGAAWEQMIGRVHRSGQMADEIVFEVHQPATNTEALKQALKDAEYQQKILGKTQKLLLADYAL